MRVFIMAVAVAIAITIALGVAVAALLIVGMAQVGARGLPAAVFDVALAFAWSDEPARTAARALQAAVMTLALICGAPVICTALIGEIAGLRSPFWYSGATALLACALPLASRGAVWGPILWRLPEIVPPLLSGISAGLIYWLIAGRNCAAASRIARPGDAHGFDLAQPHKSGSTDVET